MTINVYILRGALFVPYFGPTARMALEEKLSAACESPWQHERFEAALDGRNLWPLDQLKPHIFPRIKVPSGYVKIAMENHHF